MDAFGGRRLDRGREPRHARALRPHPRRHARRRGPRRCGRKGRARRLAHDAPRRTHPPDEGHARELRGPARRDHPARSGRTRRTRRLHDQDPLRVPVRARALLHRGGGTHGPRGNAPELHRLPRARRRRRLRHALELSARPGRPEGRPRHPDAAPSFSSPASTRRSRPACSPTPSTARASQRGSSTW